MHIYFCNGCGMSDCVAIVDEERDEPERCLQNKGFRSNWKEVVA